jgi:enterochelin esterase-like enzyme
MMKIIMFLILGTATFLNAQNQFQDFLNRVNSISDPAEKEAVIDSFMIVAREQGIPFIEGNTANFIYLGNVNSITVPGDFNGWDLDAASMVNLTQTNFWYYSQDFELNARLDYKFVLNGNTWILDPENPNTIMGGFGPNSELAMPEFIQPWEIKYNPEIEHGTMEDKSIFSTHLNGTYQLKIYLPPGYNETAAYPTVYLHDGFEYVTLASAVNVLDNLLDSNKIKPIISVFVKPNNRNSEYAFAKRNQYRLFFVEELVPFIDSVYSTIPEAENRLIMGLSFGGNISALIAYNHPEVFGLCALQSAAFWPNNFEAFNLIVNGPVKNIKWSSVWGSYESLYNNMQDFRDFLISNNYELDWLELPDGHSWGLWRSNIDNALTYFFPASATSVEDNSELIPEQFVLYQNYPNPFNPSTKIKFTVPSVEMEYIPSLQITLKVYDVLGNEVVTLVNEEKPIGEYEVDFDGNGLTSGIYFYQLKAGSFIITKKMILLK